MAMRLLVQNEALNENGSQMTPTHASKLFNEVNRLLQHEIGLATDQVPPRYQGKPVVYTPANQSTFGPDRQQRHSDINGNLWDSTGHISNLPIFGSTTGYSESMDYGPLVKKLLTTHANYLSKESLVFAYNPWHGLC